MIDAMELKRTKLFSTHKKLNAKMFEFAGWEMPLEYTSATKEHDCVRKSAGLFDVSHMGELEVKGEDAFKFIQHLITNDISNLKKDEIIYSPMCYENGMTVDDLLIYMIDENNYLLVINAGNIEKIICCSIKYSHFPVIDTKIVIRTASAKRITANTQNLFFLFVFLPITK